MRLDVHSSSVWNARRPRLRKPMRDLWMADLRRAAAGASPSLPLHSHRDFYA